MVSIIKQEEEMRKESFKQGRWAEQEHVLKLIDECELKEGWTINPEELKSKIEG